MGKATTKAQNKYIAKTYDRINLTMPKGKKEDVQAHAAQFGESVNAFINRAIDETINRDNLQSAAKGDDQHNAQNPTGTH